MFSKNLFFIFPRIHTEKYLPSTYQLSHTIPFQTVHSPFKLLRKIYTDWCRFVVILFCNIWETDCCTKLIKLFPLVYNNNIITIRMIFLLIRSTIPFIYAIALVPLYNLKKILFRARLQKKKKNHTTHSFRLWFFLLMVSSYLVS